MRASPTTTLSGPDAVSGILLDYDGVIARNTVQLGLDWLTKRLSRRAPLSERLVLSYARSVAGVGADFIELLCRAVGEPWTDDLLRELEDHLQGRIVLDPALPELLRACDARAVPVRVLSSAKAHRLASVPGLAGRVLTLSGDACSKADIRVYQAAAAQLGLAPEQVLMVDDHPLVLGAAKTAGMRTALMKGLASADDTVAYGAHVDLHLASLGELLSWFLGSTIHPVQFEPLHPHDEG